MVKVTLTSPEKKQKFDQEEVKQPKVKGINTFVLMFFIIVIMTALTYFLPAGQYERSEVEGRTVVDSTSFAFIESTPVGFFDMFVAIHQGMINAAPIMLFVILFGGALGIMQKTGAIDAFVKAVSIKFGSKQTVLIPILVLVFASLGALIGSAEDTLVYIAIVIPLTIALGMDAMTGFAIVMLGTLATGFTAGITNPFNVGVAQTISELPMYSGIGLRIALFFVMYIVTVLFILRHAKKVQNNKELGIYGKFDADQKIELDVSYRMSGKHKISIFILFITFASLIYGVIQMGWYISEIAAIFLLAGIVMGIICKMSLNDMGEGFVTGSKEMIEGALIIGFAQTIIVVATAGGLMDTILYYVSSLLASIPAAVNTIGMLFLQMFMNFIVPSGSGQAALTMPIIAPLSDFIGITRQTAVLAFQLGDGISNLLMPTSGVLLAGLAIAGIPYTKWVKWVLPYLATLTVVAIIFLLFAQFTGYGPF